MPYLGAVQLATTTLGSSASSVTFSNIPTKLNGLYLRDLICVIAGAADGNRSFAVYYNNDTTSSNYSFVNAGDFGSYSGASSEGGEVGSGQSTNIIQIMDYSATDKHKTLISRRSNPGSTVGMVATRWANTSAITSVKIQLNAGSMNTGTVLSLYATVRKP